MRKKWIHVKNRDIKQKKYKLAHRPSNNNEVKCKWSKYINLMTD